MGEALELSDRGAVIVGVEAASVDELLDAALACTVAEAQAAIRSTVHVATVLDLLTSAVNGLR